MIQIPEKKWRKIFIIEIENRETGIIIELKYAEIATFDAAYREALKQINNQNYEEKLIGDGMIIILKYVNRILQKTLQGSFWLRLAIVSNTSG